MASRRLTLSLATVLGVLVSLPATSRGQDQPELAPGPDQPPPAAPAPPPAPAPAGPSDLALKALGDRVVTLRLPGGAEIVGRIMAVDAVSIVVRTSPSEQVITLPRASVVAISLRDAPGSAAADPATPARPPRPGAERHVALNFSLAPGLMVDLEYGLFHAFANVGIVLPLATSGNVIPFSVGLGVGIPLSPRSPGLRFDIFGYVAVSVDQDDEHYQPSTDSISNVTSTVGFGVGLGLHNTWNNGFTVGFTVPIVGYCVIRDERHHGVGETTGRFYLTSAAALPLLYLGYRF